VHQLATGAIHQGQPAEACTWLLDQIDRAKWALWNGQLGKTLEHLSELRVWTWNARADPSWLDHLRTHLSELTCYLDANADSLPNYGARHRQGAPISTAFVESAVNEIVSRRMVKRQQMERRDKPAWSRGCKSLTRKDERSTRPRVLPWVLRGHHGSVNRGTDGLGIELRKDAIGAPTLSFVAEGHMTRSANASC
jgi:hypothetical protein